MPYSALLQKPTRVSGVALCRPYVVHARVRADGFSLISAHPPSLRFIHAHSLPTHTPPTHTPPTHPSPPPTLFVEQQLVELYGAEADKHLFCCLVNAVDFSFEGRGNSSGGGGGSSKDGQQVQLLIQEANALITKPNFASILCYAFEKTDNKVGDWRRLCMALAPMKQH